MQVPELLDVLAHPMRSGVENLKGSMGLGPHGSCSAFRAPGLDATAGYQAPEEELVKFKEGVPNLRVPKRPAKSARERRYCGPRPRGGGRPEETPWS